MVPVPGLHADAGKDPPYINLLETAKVEEKSESLCMGNKNRIGELRFTKLKINVDMNLRLVKLKS